MGGLLCGAHPPALLAAVLSLVTGVCCTRSASIKRGSGAIARASITTTAIGEEHYLLIHLRSLRAENLEQPPLGLGVVRLDKAEGLV